MDEHAIIAGIRAGNDTAYEWLYKLHYRPLCQYAFTLVKDHFDAEGVVNDVFFSMWQNKGGLEIQSLRNYLIRAVRNRCLNHLAQQRRQTELVSSFGQLQHGDPAVAPQNTTPLEHMLEKELDFRIRSLLMRMSEPTASIFRLSRFKHMKYHQIAEHTGLSVDVIKYHIKRALSLLRNGLKDYFDLPPKKN